MFAQQSLQPKLSWKRYDSGSQAVQNGTIFKSRLQKTESVSVMDRWVTHGRR